MKNYRELLGNISTLMFDYDGVLNDGQVYLIKDEEPLRTIHVKDGYALQHAVKQGLRIVIISGGSSESVRVRLNKSGISEVFLGVHDKLTFFNEYIAKHKIDVNEVSYMGDDIPDFPVMKVVALPCCPADASNEIKNISLYISNKNGGAGCVRDIIEQVLKVKNKWFNDGSFIW